MHVSIPELLSDEHSLGIFLLVSVVMGGGAAWLAGRAIASTWRPWWHLALYMLPLSAAVRFLHYALFDGKFLSLHYYLVDYAVCLAFGSLGFHLTRATQMVTRYKWIHERAGLFRWRRRDDTPAADTPKSEGHFLCLQVASYHERLAHQTRGGPYPLLSRGEHYETLAHAWSGPRPRPRFRAQRFGASQAGGRRTDHRRQRRLRRAAQERSRAGGRGHQRRRRYSGTENPGFRRRRPRRSERRRLGRQQVRRRWRQIRRRPLQFRRHHSVLRSLPGERHARDHAGGHQSQGHRTQHVEHLPHVRARRPAGGGRGRLHCQEFQGQEGRHRARQNDLRAGPRRGDAQEPQCQGPQGSDV